MHVGTSLVKKQNSNRLNPYVHVLKELTRACMNK